MHIQNMINKEYLISRKTYFNAKTVIFQILMQCPSMVSRFFAFSIVQNGLADFSWPGTAGALVPGNEGPGFLALKKQSPRHGRKNTLKKKLFMDSSCMTVNYRTGQGKQKQDTTGW